MCTLISPPYFLSFLACRNILKALVYYSNQDMWHHMRIHKDIKKRGNKTKNYFSSIGVWYIEKVILYSAFVCSNGTSFQCLFVNQKYYKRNLNLSFYLLLLRWVFMMVVTSDNPSIYTYMDIVRDTCLVCILCKKRCKYVSFLVARNEGTLRSMSRTCECSERYFIWKDFILF